MLLSAINYYEIQKGADEGASLADRRGKSGVRFTSQVQRSKFKVQSQMQSLKLKSFDQV